MSIKAKRVEDLFSECVSDAGHEVEGIMMKVKMNVSGKEDEIAAILAELPDEFHQSKGGGWTFLNACDDRHGSQWTGMQTTMDKLFMLGIAAGKARWLVPREMWSAFPGGMPYVSVL